MEGSMAKLTIQQRILNFLQKNAPNSYSNKEIANYLKINFNTTRRELGDLINVGDVEGMKSSTRNKTYYFAA